MKFLTLVTVAAPALATFSPPELLKRQSDCPIGYKTCGDGCISATWSCCPREDGGCPPLYVCGIADNDETGCCPIGEICTGDAGVSTDYNTYTSTIWSTIEDETTSTIVEEDTTTYSASLPILTLTSTSTAEEETSAPPVDLPSPIPTGNATTTEIPPIPSGDGAAAVGVAGNLVGGVVAGAAMLLV